MSTTNHYCKVCSLWVNGNIGNVKRHEFSDFHKGNVQKQIKLANEKSKMDRNELNRVNKELEAISQAATKSMAPSSTREVPTGWVSLTDPKTGQPYLFNKSTGETRWLESKPVNEEKHALQKPSPLKSTIPAITASSPISVVSKPVEKLPTSDPPPRPVTSAPPPRPVTGVPPPRPVTGVPPPRPTTTAPVSGPHVTIKPQSNSVDILKTVMRSEEEAIRNDPSRRDDTSTGFGEWQEVSAADNVVSQPAEVEEDLEDVALFQKRENMNVGFRVVKREAPEDGDEEEEPVFSKRQIKKSSRTRPITDD